MGYVLRLYQEEQEGAIDNPREWNNAGTMVCWHSRYNLGDHHCNASPRDFLENLAYEIDQKTQAQLECQYYEDTAMTEEDYMNALMEVIQQGAYILPLYLYDHSGITMNTSGFSCPWDSGQVGWIYMTYDTAQKEHFNEQEAINCLNGEVKCYDQYINGEVYGYQIVETDEEGNEIDSVAGCTGFYGDDMEENGMIESIQDEGYEVEVPYTKTYQYISY